MVFFVFPFVSIGHSWLYVRTINEDDDKYLLETCIIMCYIITLWMKDEMKNSMTDLVNFMVINI